jgi:hypothetical protein
VDEVVKAMKKEMLFLHSGEHASFSYLESLLGQPGMLYNYWAEDSFIVVLVSYL